VTTSPQRPADGPVRRPFGELPTALVLFIAGGGLVAVAFDHWRRGIFLIGLAALVGAGLRLFLRTRDAGLLAVRSRVFDVVALLCMGGAILILTKAVPSG
jgi:hypothetical protein